MSRISSSSKHLLTLSLLPGVGPASLRKVLAIPQFEQLDSQELASYVPSVRKALTVPGALEVASELAENQLIEAEKHDARIISVLDAEYPKLLTETKDDPFILYIRGRLSESPEKSVAIIGTREPTAHGEVIASRISQFFSEKKWSIISGLALGCDGIAHQAALDSGGHTVAVLAHGLQMISPSKHKKLAENILAAGGALVSEYPFGRKVQNQQYVKRDLTQAGMAQGVVMIQSDLKGGSLYASRAALAYKRWLAIPYPTTKDRDGNEKKIQANLLVSDGLDSEKKALLHCDSSSLKRILILKSKEDYFAMLDASSHFHEARFDASSQTVSLAESHEDQHENGEKALRSAGFSLESEPQFELVSIAGDAPLSTHDEALVTVAEAKVAHNSLEAAASEDAIAKQQAFDFSISQPSNAGFVDALREFSDGDVQLISTALGARLKYAQHHLDAIKLTYSELLASNNAENLPHHILLHIDDFFAQIACSASIFLALDECRKIEAKKPLTIKDLISKEQNFLLRNDYSDGLTLKQQDKQNTRLLVALRKLNQLSSYRLILGEWMGADCTKTSYLKQEIDEPTVTTPCQSQMLEDLKEVVESFNEMINQALDPILPGEPSSQSGENQE